MTIPLQNEKSLFDQTKSPELPKRRVDPILQEVYDLKAKLNAEAGYSVEKILERVRNNAAARAAKP
jgi:hypothetical protein